MGRKGEHREHWTGEGAPPAEPGAERPGEGLGWLAPGLAARTPRRLDPFGRRRFLGPKGYRRPDDRIQDEVCERIARSGVDAREVEVAVQGGEVTLTGTALSREDKRALEDVVDDVYGVEDVHNRLTLARPSDHRGRGRRRERGDTH